jgi:hypothetical protein
LCKKVKIRNVLPTTFAYRSAAQLAAQIFAHLVLFCAKKVKIRIFLPTTFAYRSAAQFAAQIFAHLVLFESNSALIK